MVKNLPKLHERTLMMSRAEAEITYDFIKARQAYSEMTYEHVIGAKAQLMVNLVTGETVVICDLQRDYQRVLEKAAAEHGLSIGEQIKILSALTASDAKYLIRIERHGDDDKEGDVAY